ncbi:DUF3859 domain-containing protein [Cytophagaceae bacterium DM2B3-1]|uniref:DUF3859 domain-containing protein n=1 Tax=Xanthocytophaga flava TaxID=3048013 RepID=A0ABT7CFZ3_9BACT|nr:DUF3859 domain-containing protein [Xanthocytophaga flavus]MDJ1473126.1 DUF3859 domain-containing protein [Xanthocytophaga flavus]MDJ1491977.1 DUF3859 domain-containing protein [Xanthocytophaga flavus]
MNLYRRIKRLLLIEKEFVATLGEYGTLDVDLNADSYVKILDTNLLNGYRHEAKDKYDPVFLNNTDQIKAEIGTTFGISFYFLVNNSHREVDIEITLHILHPEMTNPLTQISARSQTDTFIYTTPYYQYMHVTFEHEYELVKGQWTFQVWKNSELVIEKIFEII